MASMSAAAADVTILPSKDDARHEKSRGKRWFQKTTWRAMNAFATMIIFSVEYLERSNASCIDGMAGV